MSKYIYPNGHKTEDLSGNKYGMWTVLECVPAGLGNKIKWLCKCDCGKTKKVVGYSLKGGYSLSCGCTAIERRSLARTTHGMSKSKVYKLWNSMRDRCSNPNNDHYSFYGNRGIKVCKEWDGSFETFIKDMGPRPSFKHSIERKDVNGDYCKENCIWATIEVQARNKRSTHFVDFYGVTMNITDWAKTLNICSRKLSYHILKGRTLDWIIEKFKLKYYPASIKVSYSFGYIF